MPSQLHDFAPPGLKVFGGYAAGGQVKTRSADSIPRMRWPDGHYCMEAQLFMLSLLRKGYAHQPRGGTLGTYAAYLSDLIRYCHERKGKSFAAMNDGDFSLCVENLYQKKRSSGSGGLANNRTTVRSVAGVWLDFLSFVGVLYGQRNFVAPNGHIRATYVPSTGAPDERRRGSSGWQHSSLGERDPYNFKSGLSDLHLKKLRDAVPIISRSNLSRRRRLVMLELFDTVGLRRIEASRLRIRHILAAQEEWTKAVERGSRPSSATLRFIKAKSKGNALREVPISVVTLGYFLEYVGLLERLLRRIGLKFGPDTPLFVNLGNNPAHRGKSVAAGYFTLEFHELAKAAGITVPCSPHTARHRYIVKEFVRLILSYRLENTDQFRRALLDIKGLSARLRQLTGHKTEEGLKPYIEEAFDEITNMPSVLRRIDASRNIEALAAAHERFQLALATPEDPLQAARELSRAFEAYQAAVSTS